MIKMILSFFLMALALGSQALGVSVRTIAFSSPERTLTMKVSLPDNPEFTELIIERENFGNKVDLKPGTYRASIESLGKSTQFTIPENGFSRCFLMVFVDLANPLVIVPVADDTKSIPFGTYHIVNVLNRDVAVIFDKQKVLLKPGKSHVFKMPKMPAERNIFPVKMASTFEGKPGLTQFLKSYWSYQPDRRYISIICQLPSFTLPVVRSIPELQIDAERAEPAKK